MKKKNEEENEKLEKKQQEKKQQEKKQQEKAVRLVVQTEEKKKDQAEILADEMSLEEANERKELENQRIAEIDAERDAERLRLKRIEQELQNEDNIRNDQHLSTQEKDQEIQTLRDQFKVEDDLLIAQRAKQELDRQAHEIQVKLEQQKMYEDKAEIAINVMRQAEAAIIISANHKKNAKKDTGQMILELKISQVSFNAAIAPRRKLGYVASVGSSYCESQIGHDVNQEGLFPLEPIQFSETINLSVKFRKDNQNSKKGKTKGPLLSPPTILSICFFAYSPEDGQWSAQDLIGEWLCGQNIKDEIGQYPSLTAVNSFWKSIEGQREVKQCHMYANKQTTGTFQFTAILKENTTDLKPTKAELSFDLSAENKAMLLKGAQEEKTKAEGTRKSRQKIKERKYLY